MNIPNVRSVKVYAVIESVIEAPCDPKELDQFLKNSRFGGSTTVGYTQGGIRTVVVREQIPLTEAKLDKILEKA